MSLTRPLSRTVTRSLTRTLSSSDFFGASATVPVTLLVAMGQSNSLGWGTGASSATAVTAGYGFQWYPTAPTTGVVVPLGKAQFGRSTVGAVPSFVQTWAGNGGGPALVCMAGVNGASMDNAVKSSLVNAATVNAGGGTWDLTDAANHYDNWAAPMIQAAIDGASGAGMSVARVVVLWSQGEQDAASAAGTNGATYRSKLNDLIARLVTDFDIDAFLISKTSANTTPASFTAFLQDIRTAQDNVAADNPTLCPTPFDTADFYDEGKYVDTQHYTAAGYNEMGAALATAGISHLSLSEGVPGSGLFDGLVALGPPEITGWSRIRLTHATTSFGASLFTWPAMPYAPTFIDATGINSVYAGTAPSWTYSGEADRVVWLYQHSSATTNAQLHGSASAKIKQIEVLDAIKLNRLYLPSVATGYRITDADFANITWSASANIDIHPSSAVSANLDITEAILPYLSTAASIGLTGIGAPIIDLTQTGGTNVKSLNATRVGLTTAQVNAYLTAIDANGYSGGSVSLLQYQASPAIAAAPPSGAGATAKTNLQGRGYTVTTD